MSSSTTDRPQRKSVTLTPRDLEDIAKLRGTPVGREALRALAGVDQVSSEAQVLHAVIEAGLRVLRERVQEEAYAELARDTAYAEERRATARHRRPSWADEPSS